MTLQQCNNLSLLPQYKPVDHFYDTYDKDLFKNPPNPNELQTLANELLLSDTQAEIGITVSTLVTSMTVKNTLKFRISS